MKTEQELIDLMRIISPDKFAYIDAYYQVSYKNVTTLYRFADCVLSEYFNDQNRRKIRECLKSMHGMEIPVTYTHQTVRIYQTMEELKFLVEELQNNNIH